MKPLVEILLVPASDQETLYLQSELQKYLETLAEGASRVAVLAIGRGWLEGGHERKVCFESEVYGNKEATNDEELREVVRTLYVAMTPTGTGMSEEIERREKWKAGKQEAKVDEVVRALDPPRKVIPVP